MKQANDTSKGGLGAETPKAGKVSRRRSDHRRASNKTRKTCWVLGMVCRLLLASTLAGKQPCVPHLGPWAKQPKRHSPAQRPGRLPEKPTGTPSLARPHVHESHWAEPKGPYPAIRSVDRLPPASPASVPTSNALTSFSPRSLARPLNALLTLSIPLLKKNKPFPNCSRPSLREPKESA